MVDTESTGLDLDNDRAVEVGWLELSDPFGHGPTGLFIPPHDITQADPEALQINRYHERLAGEPVDQDYEQTRILHIALLGQTLAGANPRFDAAMLTHLFRDAGLTPTDPWHHRLVDVEAYAAGALAIPPDAIPGLDGLCQGLDLPRPDHSALGDATAAAAVLAKLTGRGGR